MGRKLSMEGFSGQKKRAVNAKVFLVVAMMVAIAFVGLLMLATEDSHALSGDGSESDPYILESEADLQRLQEGLGAEKWFKLGNDITVIGAWVPMGTSANPFRGHLDGNEHTITLGTVTPSQYTGFFGALDGAEVTNLRITLTSTISPVTNTTPLYVGGLAGYINNSTVFNVLVDGAGINFSLTGARQVHAGGLAGYVSNSDITYAFSKINVTVGGSADDYISYAGGLIGYGSNNHIDASMSYGNVDISVGKAELSAGGFIGSTTGGSITRSGAAGDVRAYNNFPDNKMYARVGGFAGFSNTPLENVYSRGNVQYIVDKPNAQGGYIGGLVGESASTIGNAYSTGSAYTNLSGGNGGYHGGLLTGTGSVNTSYYNSTGPMTPSSNNTVGQGLNDTQMKDVNNFGPTWKIGDWIWEGGYPDLAVFSFIIDVVIDPSSSFGYVSYSLNSPTTETSPLYTGTLIGIPWDTFHFQATATSGRVFLHWSGGDDPSVFEKTTYVTVPAPPKPAGPIGSRTVTAYFEDLTNTALLTLNAVPAGMGAFSFVVEGIDGEHQYTGPQYFAKGMKVSAITRETGTVYSFAFWAANEDWSTSRTTGLIELQEDLTLNAVFVRDTDPILELIANPVGAGQFTYEIRNLGAGINWIGPISYSEPVRIPSGFDIRITAIPDEDSGYLFTPPSGWGGAGTTVGQLRQIAPMNTNSTVTATFERGAIVTAIAVPEMGGTFTFSRDGTTYLSRPGDKITIPIGGQVWIRASAESDYTFSYWQGRPLGVDTITLTPTADVDLSAYFYLTDDSYDVTTTVIGAGNLTVTVGGVPSQIQTSGSRTLKVSAGDDVTITATDGPGEFMFYIGTVPTDERTINILDINRNYSETAYFTNGLPTVNLDVNVVGSGYVVIQIQGWAESIDTRVFAPGPILTIKVQVGGTVTMTAFGDGGLFQNFVFEGSSTEYYYNPSFSRPISVNTTVTAYFTDTTDVYWLDISASSGNWITYSIDGAPWISYFSTDNYRLFVDNTKDTNIGYIEGTGLFQHFNVDAGTTAAVALPGPTELFTDRLNHIVRAIFTDDKINFYTLTINVYGIGSVYMGVGNDPYETITSTGGAVVTREITPDDYKPFSVNYRSGSLQYFVCTLPNGEKIYDFNTGISVSPPLELDQYIVDVYFLDDATAGSYELALNVVGSGRMTFDIGNGSGPVPLTASNGQLRIPLLLTDEVAIDKIEGPGKFQYYTHRYGTPLNTDVYLTVMPTITSALGNQAVTAYFTDSATTSTLTLGTYGSGYVTFTINSITGKYQSPTPGAPFLFPMNLYDSVQIGYEVDAGKFQFYLIDDAVQFTAPSPLSGATNHSAIAYFTNTGNTFDLTIGTAGSGMIIAEISTYPSLLIVYSSSALQTRTIPLEIGDTATISAEETNGHFQYFSVTEAGGSPFVVMGDKVSPIDYNYPGIITGETRIVALFTDNRADDYLLVLNVDPKDAGTIFFNIGNDPVVSFRGDDSPIEFWVDPYEGTTIGYDDSGPNDGHFQYFVYVYESFGTLVTEESRLSIPLFYGVTGDKYTITAKFTDDKVNVWEYSLATTGDGFVTFKHGSDPVGRYSSPGLDSNDDPIPYILYVNKSDTVDTIVNMDEYDWGNPQYVGSYFFDDNYYYDEDPMPDLILSPDKDHTVIVFFDESGLTYILVVYIHGIGTAGILDGTEIPEDEEAGGEAYAVYIVHAYRNVTITAANGLFQGTKMTREGNVTWHPNPYVIPSGTMPAGTEVQIDIYFTYSNSIYYLNLYTETGGMITYDIDGSGERSVGYQELGIPVDIDSNVAIGSYESSGKFQYFKYGVSGSTASDITIYDPFTVEGISQNASVNVTALFTVSSNTYELWVGTVGDGYVTFTEGRTGRQTEVVRSEPGKELFMIPMDVGISVTVGWQETNSSVVRFQYLMRTTYPSDPILQRAVWQVTGVTGGVYEAVAYFTDGPQYYVSLSTNTNDVRGSIGLLTNDGDISLWHTGTTRTTVPVNLTTDVKVTHRADSGMEFEFFVLNNVVTFPDDPDSLDITDTVAPAENSVVDVIAYFANLSASYTVNLSTIGSGSITYTIDGYSQGRFNSDASLGLPYLEFKLNNDTSLAIGNAPLPGTMFTYYIVTKDSGAPVIATAPPTQSEYGSYNEIVARFTGTDYYTLRLSGTGGGSITFKVGTDPWGEYSGAAQRLLYVDVGTDVEIGSREGAGKFRWFIQDIGGDANVYRSPPTVPYVDQSIEAVFIANAFFVTLDTVGNGQVTIRIGSYTYAYKNGSPDDNTLPVAAGTQVYINYIEDTTPVGHFQQFDYEMPGPSVRSLNAPFNFTGTTGEEYAVTAYFTSTEDTYRIDLSRYGVEQGGGQITYKIESRSTVGITNPHTAPFPLFVDKTDSVVIGYDSGLYSFQYFDCTGSLYSGPITDTELLFEAGTEGEHSVTAYFTRNLTSNTYAVNLGTVGDGYITFRLNTMGIGQYAKYQSPIPGDTYELRVDPTDSVTIGNEEGGGYFIGFTQGTSSLLNVSTTINVDNGTFVPNTVSNRTIKAYFTEDKTNVYSVDLSTIGNGFITYEYKDLGVNGRFMSGTVPERTIYVDFGDELTIGHAIDSRGYFNAFVVDGTTVLGEDEIIYDDTNIDDHRVVAVFTVGTTAAEVYEVIVATTGSGYITFEVPGFLSGKYSGPEWSVHVDRGNTMYIGNEPDESFFQFYEITVGASPATINLRETFSVPPNTTGSRLVKAHFTADDINVYALTLSTVGNGSITFTLPGTPRGQFMSDAVDEEYVLYVDNGVTANIGYIAGGPGRFQFFVYDDELDAVSQSYSITDDENHDIVAHFTNSRNTYNLTLGSVGGGHVEFELNSALFSTSANITFPVDIGTMVPVEAVADLGVFRFIVYDSVVYMQNSRNVIENGGNHVLTAYFTVGTPTMLTVDKTGVGRVDVRIVTNGITIPTIVGFTGTIPMELTDSVTLNAVETASTDKFVNWTSDDPAFEGLAIAVISFEMANNITAIANFAPATSLWKLTLATTDGGSASFIYDGGWGSVGVGDSSDFNIPRGSEVELTASPSTGFEFTNWSSNDSRLNVASSVVTFDIVRDTTATAVFFLEEEVWKLTLSAGTGGSASFSYDTDTERVTGGPVATGPAEEFFIPKTTSVELASSADAGCAFVYWTSSDTNVNNIANPTLTFVISDDTTVEAVFDSEDNVWKLTLSASIGGSASFEYGPGTSSRVTGSVVAGQTEIFFIPESEMVDLTATPAAGYEFTNWASDDPDLNGLARPETSFEMPTYNITVTAKFAPATSLWKLTLSAGTGGSASFGYGTGASRVSDSVAEGETEDFFIPRNSLVDLTGTADIDHAFVYWTGSDASFDNCANSTVTFTIVSNTTAEAVFDLIDNVFKLTLSTTTGGSATFRYEVVWGKVTPNDSVEFFIPIGSDVDFSAAPISSAYLFGHWEEDAAGNPREFTETIFDEYFATAVFVLSAPNYKTYLITASSDDNSVINPSGKVTVVSGNDRTFTFSAKTGYHVSAVYVDSVALSSEEVASGAYTFRNVLSNHTIEVESEQGYTLTLYVDVEGGEGTPEYRTSPTGNYNRFVRSQQIAMQSDLFVSFAAGNGYTFVEWTGDIESSEIELMFLNADRDIYLIAHLRSDDDDGGGGWAVLNLILAVLAVFTGLFAVVAGRDRWKKDKEGLSKATTLRIIALVLGTFSLVIFFITEDMSRRMGTYDAWTPLAAILFVVVLIIVILSYKVYDKD